MKIHQGLDRYLRDREVFLPLFGGGLAWGGNACPSWCSERRCGLFAGIFLGKWQLFCLV